MIKKAMVMMLGAALLVSSCGSYEATGAYTGAQFGHVIGSAIGGVSGGWRGHELGSLIGTVTGTVAGAVVGAAADKKQERKAEERVARRNGGTRVQGPLQSPSSDRTMRVGGAAGDDRISFTTDDVALEIRNAGIYEKQHDGVLTRGEECTVVFEIHNTSGKSIRDVYPLVEDVTGNKHVNISPNLRIESIAPYKAVRYTATILADGRLKDGEIQVMVGVAHQQQVVESQTRMFTIPTAKAPR